jgi:hypothetical protein
VETIKTPGLLQPLSIPSQCWEEASMDFITGLPKSKGKSVIMVIVDRLTKYAHFCALSHPFKASIVSTTFMETVQKLHGNPKIIVSHRDPIFIVLAIFLVSRLGVTKSAFCTGSTPSVTRENPVFSSKSSEWVKFCHQRPRSIHRSRSTTIGFSGLTSCPGFSKGKCHGSK